MQFKVLAAYARYASVVTLIYFDTFTHIIVFNNILSSLYQSLKQ